MSTLLTVSLRQQAVFIPSTGISKNVHLSETTGLLVANLSKLGFGVSESLLHALNHTSPAFHAKLLNTLREVMGTDKNWTPLVKGWNAPTGESVIDHIVTFFYQALQPKIKGKGVTLRCGHVIPPGTFALERYNGCPFCGTPFEFGEIENYNQGSKQKVLELWTEQEAKTYFEDLLTSKTALDATQMDSLKILLQEFEVGDVKIGMKETLMAVIDIFISQHKPEKAQSLFTTPVDILRYLWYKHTGFLQVVEPGTIIKRSAKNNKHISLLMPDKSASALLKAKRDLKLKYTRKECIMVAGWLNGLAMDAEKICELMHPKRGMWVRFIRALRLAEYSKREGFEKLRTVLDKFYRQEYKVWQASVNHCRLRYDADSTFALLKQRPGLFARSLFANMLWFGAKPSIEAFTEVIDKVPARLVFTLSMYADLYFDSKNSRIAKPVGGTSKVIPANRLLSIYDPLQLDEMKAAVSELCMTLAKKRFAATASGNKTMYIDPVLFKIPVSIGDRSENLHDLPTATAGTRLQVEGDTLRLFMQWGKGLPAQHLDMDLSCLIAYPDGKTERCSFSSLVVTGCKHSGDIRSIPEKTGTAEYIDIDMDVLGKAGAKYVSFTCNAYSYGSLTPNLVVGWMNSAYPMRISEKTGVAYDPSCVQHQVRIASKLTKGLAFGTLDVAAREIVWFELPFYGQLVQNLDIENVENIIAKLSSKLSIGQLLVIKAEAQNMQLVDTEQADEVYTRKWALNTAAVTKLMVD